MKRSDALAPLSRDHHRALFVAQQLKRADDTTAPGARDAFLEFWQEHGREHFRVEEEVLLPECAHAVAPDEDPVVRVLVDHVEIRRRAEDLGRVAMPSVESVRDLGERLERHVRHEERVLFVLIEERLTATELTALAQSVERAERAG